MVSYGSRMLRLTHRLISQVPLTTFVAFFFRRHGDPFELHVSLHANHCQNPLLVALSHNLQQMSYSGLKDGVAGRGGRVLLHKRYLMSSQRHILMLRRMKESAELLYIGDMWLMLPKGKQEDSR